MELLVLDEDLKNVIFFLLPIKKGWFYDANNKQISNSKIMLIVNS